MDIDWKNVHRILFVCHGNICRSAMAHCVMAHLLNQHHVNGIFVDSAATSTEEIGNPIYPPARRCLLNHGISILPHSARQLNTHDAEQFDLFLGADNANIQNMKRILGQRAEGRIFLLLDMVGQSRGIADPWYSGDFESTFDDVILACNAILAHLLHRQGDALP